MKIYDCTTFYSEHMMMDVRFNILDKHVHKFVVIESLFSHSGAKKKLNFDINNYPKFKDKIIYYLTLGMFDWRRYNCDKCGWEGLRWSKQYRLKNN